MSADNFDINYNQYKYRAEIRSILGACPDGMIKLQEETTRSSDLVNHPSHYTAYKGLEVIDLTEQMNFNRGNAVKYICRAGLKNPDKEVEDLEKALWYIKREIGRLEGIREADHEVL